MIINKIKQHDMNFPYFYNQTKRPDLANRAFAVLSSEPLPLPENAPQGSDAVYSLGNRYRHELRFHTMGFTKRNTKLHKAAVAFLSQGTDFMPLINQINVYLLDELVRAELFEIVPKLLEINSKLADKLDQVFPHIDVSPLRDIDEAKQELTKLMKKLDEFKQQI